MYLYLVMIMLKIAIIYTLKNDTQIMLPYITTVRPVYRIPPQEKDWQSAFPLLSKIAGII